MRGGEDFATVAREVSEDGNRAKGGEIGMRPADRLPDLFVKAVQPLKPGEIAPDLVRSGAGFHVLKLVERKESSAFTVQQLRARHILLRPSAELTAEAATRRLVQFKSDIRAARARSSSWRARTRKTAAPPRAAISAGPRPGSSCPSSRRRSRRCRSAASPIR